MTETTRTYDDSNTFGLFPSEDDSSLFSGHFEKNYNNVALARVTNESAKLALNGELIGTLDRVDDTEDGTPHYKGVLSIHGKRATFHGFINSTAKGLVLNVKLSAVRAKAADLAQHMPAGF